MKKTMQNYGLDITKTENVYQHDVTNMAVVDHVDLSEMNKNKIAKCMDLDMIVQLLMVKDEILKEEAPKLLEVKDLFIDAYMKDEKFQKSVASHAPRFTA